MEPALTVLVFLAVSTAFSEPIGRADLTLCLLVFALTFPGRNRFWDRPLNIAVDISTSWLSLLFILALCGYATRSLQLFEPAVLTALLASAARWLVLLILAFVVALNAYLFVKVPKGFFPQQDTGQISGGIRADRSISFQALQGKLKALVDIIKNDPAVDTVVGFTGGSRAGGGFMFINLKPVAQRSDAGQAVIARLRPQLASVTGVSLFLNPVQDLRGGGRQSSSTYQYTLKSDNATDLRVWATRLADQMKQQEALTDVDTDQEEHGVETMVTVDKESAARLGISSRDVDNALYNAFGQRQVATVYGDLNQYRVIMGMAPKFARSPESLKDIYVPARNAVSSSGPSPSATTAGPGPTIANPALRDPSAGQVLSASSTVMVPLSAIASFTENSAASSVSHEDGELSTTISYNLAPGSTLAEAEAAVSQSEAAIGLPSNVRGSFSGTALSAQESQGEQPLLILAALVVIYIVLGILYESLVHPITVLSTLPSAGVGAVLALMLFKLDFSLIALIGVFSVNKSSPISTAQAEKQLRNEARDLIEWKFEGLKEFKDAHGKVVWSDHLQKGYMILNDIPINDSNKSQYQLWIVDPKRDEAPVDGGVFDIINDGSTIIVPIVAKLSLTDPKAFVITLEQPGGVVKSKQEQLVALAKN